MHSNIINWETWRKNSYNTYTCRLLYETYTVESLLFVEIDVRGFRGSTLLTNLRPLERLTKYWTVIVMPQNSYQRNHIPNNQQNVDNPRTLAPTNKYDSTVLYTVNPISILR